MNFHNSRCTHTKKTPHPLYPWKYSVSFFTGFFVWQVNRLSFLLPPLVVFILFVEKLVCKNFALWKKEVVTITAEVEFPICQRDRGSELKKKKKVSHILYTLFIEFVDWEFDVQTHCTILKSIKWKNTFLFILKPQQTSQQKI